MSTAKDTRKLLLDNSEEIVKQLLKIGLGKLTGTPDARVLLELFKRIAPAIELGDDAIPFKHEGDAQESINDIVKQLSKGEITAPQAKTIIEALNQSLDLSKLETLIEDLERDTKGNTSLTAIR